jgi:hypothetical protein
MLTDRYLVVCLLEECIFPIVFSLFVKLKITMMFLKVTPETATRAP